MTRFLKTATPEGYFVFSAFIGIVLAGIASRIPGLGLSFVTLVVILLSIDVITYVAMKAGWIRTPRQRSGLDS